MLWTAFMPSGSPSAAAVVLQGYPVGLTGAVGPTRFVGGTVSGAPVTSPTGGWLVGDFVVTQAGSVWICTVAGSPGTWKPIGGRVLASTETTVTWANTAVEQTLLSLAIPAGLVVAGDRMRLQAMGDMFSNPGGSINATFSLKIGATPVLTTAAVAISNSAQRRKWLLDANIAMESTALERVGAALNISAGGADTWAGASAAASAIGYGTASEDTATAKNVALTVLMSAANPLSDVRMHAASLILTRKPV